MSVKEKRKKKQLEDKNVSFRSSIVIHRGNWQRACTPLHKKERGTLSKALSSQEELKNKRGVSISLPITFFSGKGACFKTVDDICAKEIRGKIMHIRGKQINRKSA